MSLFSQCRMWTRSVDFHGSVGAGSSQLHNSKAIACSSVFVAARCLFCHILYYTYTIPYYTILYYIVFVAVVAVITGMTSTKMRRRSCADVTAARKKLKLHLTSRGIGIGLGHFRP